ncbi:MAG: hypothetical protein QXG12_08180, partial [Thermoproteota archaeon]
TSNPVFLALALSLLSRSADSSGVRLPLTLLTLKATLPVRHLLETESITSLSETPLSSMQNSSYKKWDRASLRNALKAGSNGASNL